MANNPSIGRTAILNWSTLAISLAVAFFLSPFLVHRLGTVGYGIWTLVTSLISYMALLDLGLRGTVTRFVSRYHAQGAHEESSRAVSAVFWIRIWTALVILAGTALLSTLAPSVLRIPPEMQFSTRWAMVLVGTSLAVTITFGIFGAVLSALQRFDLLCGVSITQTAVRTAGTIWLLKSGYGIVALAMWEFFVVILANTALTALAMYVYREIRVIFRRPDAATLRQLGGYSFYLIAVNACHQVINYTDNLVVGAFISAAAVTFYTIAGGLLEYGRQMVSALGLAFLPLASSMDARGQKDQLRNLLVQGTCATLLVGLPIYTALFFRGHTFIGLWLGQEYADVSGNILRVLLVGQIFLIAQYTNYNILCALGKQKPLALRLAAEAVANLILSVVLARRIGLMGVAIGTLIPSVINHALFGSRYLCGLLEVPVSQFVWRSWARSALAVLPFGFACYLTDHLWVAASMIQFMLQIAVIMPVFLLGVALVFWKETSEHFVAAQNWLARLRSSRALRASM
jgi:O-antigen/teichoic acid export membrane protein